MVVGVPSQAGFLFPTIVSMLRKGAPEPPHGASRRKQYPVALVLAPTRELASQIFEEAQKVNEMPYDSFISLIMIPNAFFIEEAQNV
jgi:superfamily II DNA/RNA helicase